MEKRVLSSFLMSILKSKIHLEHWIEVSNHLRNCFQELLATVFAKIINFILIQVPVGVTIMSSQHSTIRHQMSDAMNQCQILVSRIVVTTPTYDVRKTTAPTYGINVH